MNRNWNDFKSLHGNIAGAREAFEDACETLYRKKHPENHVSQVKVKQGDGGIDIFIGELGVEPITVIQCKFFLESFGASQQSQIRESFNTAINSDKYELKEWILCIPRVIDIDENTWWFKWKHRKLKEHSKEVSFIKLTNGNQLIDLLKELDLYNQVFKIDDSLKITEIHNAIVPKKVEIKISTNPQTILFNHYTKKNEHYYLERENDINFNKTLKISNIWLFGKSGAGKTALVNRNLTQSQIKYCFCDLSPTTITNSNDVLIEILVNIEEEFNKERNLNEKNVLKQISQILCENDSKEIVIVIDELSVSDENIIKNIASDLIKLVTHFSNQSTKDELKFVISTISNPMDIIKNKSKASDFFQYICCDSCDKYIAELFDILSNSIGLDIEESKDLILQSSENSPRILKNIFRKIITSDNTSPKTIANLVTLTIEETVS